MIQVGAPKGVSRLLQRIGRANHRLDSPSKALLVPANRFEVLECRAALDGVAEMTLDGDPPPPGGLDVLAQHVFGTACAGPFDADALYAEVTAAAPYADLPRRDFEDVLTYVATGGYALGAYDRWKRLARGEDGRWRLADKRFARLYRMNVGTIVEAVTIKVKLRRGGCWARSRSTSSQYLQPGDTFVFAGQLAAVRGPARHLRGGDPRRRGGAEGPWLCRRPAAADDASGRPGSRHPGGPLGLAEAAGAGAGMAEAAALAIGAATARHAAGRDLPARRQAVPGRLRLRGTQRAPDAGHAADPPDGAGAAVAAGLSSPPITSSAVWSLRPAFDYPGGIAELFDQDMLGEDLEAWMDESSLLRRTFRNVAVIAGLIERRHPGQEKTGRQMTFSADLIYDVLRRA